MFRKLYKEANDEIQINQVLKEKLKLEATKSPSKNYTKYIYRYGYMAAAILIVAVGINILPDFSKETLAPDTTPMTVSETEGEPMMARSVEEKQAVSEDLAMTSKTRMADTAMSESLYAVETFEQTPTDEAKEMLKNGQAVVTITHYKMSDGTWKTDTNSYLYKLELTGRLNNAVKDSTYIILSNTEDITFEQAWKASGLSSNMEDYFDPDEAVIVAFK